jgi:hypothetical protein
MENGNNQNANGGIGFIGALTLVFIVLKLCKVITWSWLWVLSPIWISVGLAVVIGIIAAIAISVWKAKH